MTSKNNNPIPAQPHPILRASLSTTPPSASLPLPRAMIQSKSTPEFPSGSTSRDSTPPTTPADVSSPYPLYLTTSPNAPPIHPSSHQVPSMSAPPAPSASSASSSSSSSSTPATPSPHAVLSSSLELRLPFRSPETSPTARSTSPRPGSPMPSEVSLSRTVPWRRKLVLCLVGLPARGKSYIAYKLVGYMRWRGLRAQLFNVGKHRRSQVKASQDATFFDASNTSAQQQRDALALEVLEAMLDWLQEGGDVSVFDATNTTNKRRWEVFRHVQRRSPVLRVIFVESICDDRRVLESNYAMKAKNSPDYKDMPLEAALADLRLRISNYEKVYEPISDDALSYLKLINLNSKVIANKIHGSLGHLISAYLMSIHIQPRPIYLVRTGKCEGEERIPLSQRISDVGSREDPFLMPFTINMAANLTERGREFSKRLASFLSDRAMEYFARMRMQDNLDPLMNTLTSLAAQLGVGRCETDEELRGGFTPEFDRKGDQQQQQQQQQNGREEKAEQHEEGAGSALSPASLNRSISRVDLPLIVYTSTLPRAQQTVAHLAGHALLCEQTSALNMMDTGVLHGLSVEEIRQRYPGELDRWHAQKYTYRFPGGESQADKARGLESLVMEIERHFFPVLIVSHASTLQVLYGYFLGSSRSVNDFYSLHVPQHFVIELTPNQYGWEEKRWDLRSEEEKAEDLDLRKVQPPAAAQQPSLCSARCPSLTCVHCTLRVFLAGAAQGLGEGRARGASAGLAWRPGHTAPLCSRREPRGRSRDDAQRRQSPRQRSLHHSGRQRPERGNQKPSPHRHAARAAARLRHTQCAVLRGRVEPMPNTYKQKNHTVRAKRMPCISAPAPAACARTHL